MRIESTSYIIYKQDATYYAQNGATGGIDFNGNDAGAVIQSTINQLSNGGRIFLRNGTYPIGSTLNFRNSWITLEGENFSKTSISAGSKLTNLVTKSSGTGRLVFENIGFDCVSGTATNGINFADDVEGSYNIRLENIRIVGYSGFGLNLDGNEDSNLVGGLLESPANRGKAISWKIPFGAGWISDSAVIGDIELYAQQLIIRDTSLVGVRIVGNTNILKLDTVYWNTTLSTGNAIEISSGSSLNDLNADSCYFTLANGQNLIAGNLSNEATFQHCKIAIASGRATFLPNSPMLTSKFAGSKVFARIRIIGGDFGGGGIVNLTANPWTPGVILAEVENWNRGTFGNRNLNEVPPGGRAWTKNIQLPFPYPDAKYTIDVEPQGNAFVWVTSKTETSFVLNYSVVGGITVAWTARHLDI